MNKDQLKEFVNEFTSQQCNGKGETDIFSDLWKNRLLESVWLSYSPQVTLRDISAESRSSDEISVVVKYRVEETYYGMIFSMFLKNREWLSRKFPGLSLSDAEIISAEAESGWWYDFNAKRSKTTNPEVAWLSLKTRNALSDYVRKYGVPAETAVEDLPSELEGLDFESQLFEQLEANESASAMPADVRLLSDEEIGNLPIKLGDQFHPRFGFPAAYKFLAMANKLVFETGRGSVSVRAVSDKTREPRYVEITHPAVTSVHTSNSKVLDAIQNEFAMGDEWVSPPNILYSECFERRWSACANEHIKWMELAVSVLRQSHRKKLCDLERASHSDAEAFRHVPVLGAVVVCANGKVFHAFKGERDQRDGRLDLGWAWAKHAEFSLFEEAVPLDQRHLLAGATLYVTLEPCNARLKVQRDGRPMLPCAVRCVEARLAKVYIGSADCCVSVWPGRGLDILKTGKYTFVLQAGEHSGSDEEKASARALEANFQSKEYNCCSSDQRHRTYVIGERVPYEFFDRVLQKEVYEINGEFQKRKFQENLDAVRKLGSSPIY